jgi:hypothetical protein
MEKQRVFHDFGELSCEDVADFRSTLRSVLRGPLKKKFAPIFTRCFLLRLPWDFLSVI